MGNRTDTIRVTDLTSLYKDIWGTLEALMKAIKAMPGKQSGMRIKKSMWSDIGKNIAALRAMEEPLTVGSYYKWKSSGSRDGDYLIFRVEAYEYCDSNESRPLRVVCRPLTCTKSKDERFEYQDINDEMLFSMDEVYGEIASYDLVVKDLPLFMGNKYCGSLLRELFSEDEATAGLAQELAARDSKEEEEDE